VRPTATRAGAVSRTAVSRSAIVAACAIRLLWQRRLSQHWPGACSLRPTCSEYAALAVEKHGLWAAIPKCLRRFRQCGRVVDFDYRPP